MSVDRMVGQRAVVLVVVKVDLLVVWLVAHWVGLMVAWMVGM